MKRTGKIISKHGDQMKVTFIRETSCGDKCSDCSQECGTLGHEIIIDNIKSARVGDKIDVAIDSKFLLKSAFLIYIFPLIMLIFGYLSGNNLYRVLNIPINQELFSLLFGIVFLSFAYLIVNIFDKKISTKKNLSIN